MSKRRNKCPQDSIGAKILLQTHPVSNAKIRAVYQISLLSFLNSFLQVLADLCVFQKILCSSLLIVHHCFSSLTFGIPFCTFCIFFPGQQIQEVVMNYCSRPSPNHLTTPFQNIPVPCPGSV